MNNLTANTKARNVRRLILFVSLIALSSQLGAQQQDREVQQAQSFIQSVAKTIYYFAWPTATYRSVRFAGFDRDGNNLIIQAVFSGEGLFGDTAWVKLGLVVNSNGIQDLRIIDHHELFVGPFETSKTVGGLLLELAKESSQPSRPAVQASSPGTRVYPPSSPAVTFGATCVINETTTALKFQYRWGDADWKQEDLPVDNNVTLSWNTAIGGPVPMLLIRYDDDFAEGYTEQRYRLENTMTGSAPTCEQSKQYVFTTTGSKINLNPVDPTETR